MQLHHYSTIQNTIVVPYIDGLYRYAMSITRNPTDAEDLVQETYVRAIPAMGNLEAGSNHRSWLFTILRNIRLNQLRRQRTSPEIGVSENAENVFVETSRDPLALYVSKVDRERVREAIQQLERDGFVTVIPRRGTLVSEINITSLTGIYEVRVHLEAWEARLAAERATPEERAEAARLLGELEALEPDTGAEVLLALDRRIHRFVYACGKNGHLAETLDQYHNLSLRILHVAMKRYPALTPTLEHVVHDQRLLLTAITRGDGPAAEQAAREHVLTFERAIREVI